MRKQTFTPSSGKLLRLLLFLFLSTTVFFWGCDKAKEAVSPAVKAFVAEQVQTIKAGNAKEEKDEKYKTDKTGQYVSKDVQVADNGGKERPTRPKFDAAQVIANSIPPDPYCPDCGGGTVTPPPPVTSTFVSSVSIGGYGNYIVQRVSYSNAIFDLKVIKGGSSSINTGDLPGYYKIPVDLNRGAGGSYIYLCFTRDPAKVQGSKTGEEAWVNDPQMGRNVPIRDIKVVPQTIGTKPIYPELYLPPIEVKDDFGGFRIPDLNDGAGGKFIYAYQQKGADSPSSSLPVVKEVGVIYGNSSSITPPAPWKKLPWDLNEGAGGDYIYFCVKY